MHFHLSVINIPRCDWWVRLVEVQFWMQSLTHPRVAVWCCTPAWMSEWPCLLAFSPVWCHHFPCQPLWHTVLPSAVVFMCIGPVASHAGHRPVCTLLTGHHQRSGSRYFVQDLIDLFDFKKRILLSYVLSVLWRSQGKPEGGNWILEIKSRSLRLDTFPCWAISLFWSFNF